MGWFAKARDVVARFGPAAGTALKHVVGFVPGGSVVADLVEDAVKTAADQAKSHAEGEAAMKNLATASELERLAGVFDACLGDLGKLVEAVKLHEGDSDEAIQKLIVTQLATDRSVREGFDLLGREVRRFERIEGKLDDVLSRLDYQGDLHASLRLLVRQQGDIVSFIDELRVGGLGRPFFRRVSQMHAALDALAVGKAAEAAPALQALEKECPDSGTVAVAEAVQAALSGEGSRAGDQLTRAAKLRPDDRRLENLSRRVTVATGEPRHDTDGGGTGDGWRHHFAAGKVIDGWTVTGRLGEGGMGAVFAVEKDGERRAMKVLPPALSADPVFATQFRKEILVLNGLKGLRNVVGFHDFGRHLETGCWHFQMELVAGESLQTRLDRDGPLTPAAAVGLVRQLAGDEGLAKVHAGGVTHRDIKPANILIMPDGTAVLVDFGIAGAASGGTTQFKAYTARFASLEQLRQGVVTPVSDVYSLAATLWYAITRQDAETFDRDTLPRELEPLREVLTKALDGKPSKRPANAAALAALLAAVDVARLGAAKVEKAVVPAKRRENVRMPDAAPGRWPWARGTGFVDLQKLPGYMCVAFSPDRRLIAVGTHSNTVGLWDVAASKHLRTLEGHDNSVASVAFSPDGRLIATASYDQTARLWKADTGEHVRTLEGQMGAVTGVAFSPDGRLVATASDDKTARLWMTSTGQHLHTIAGHDKVRRVAFNPGGQLVATVACDFTARLWFRFAATEEPNWELTENRLPPTPRLTLATCGNGIVHAGDLAWVRIRLENAGKGPLEQVWAEMRSESKALDGLTAVIGKVGPGRSAERCFAVLLPSDHAVGEIEAELVFHDAHGEMSQSRAVHFDVRSATARPDFPVRVAIVNGGSGNSRGSGDGKPKRGEWVDVVVSLENRTGEDLSDLEATLTVVEAGSGVEVKVPKDAIGDLPDGNGYEARVTVRLDPKAATGPATFEARVGTRDGRVFAVEQVTMNVE